MAASKPNQALVSIKLGMPVRLRLCPFSGIGLLVEVFRVCILLEDRMRASKYLDDAPQYSFWAMQLEGYEVESCERPEIGDSYGLFRMESIAIIG
jgi:hypothetical protein